MSELLLGHVVFQWVATWANPYFDSLFRIITDLGSTPLYFVCLAPLFWVVDRRRAVVLFVLLALSSYLNTYLKLWFDMPRPDPTLARVLDLRPGQQGSNGFPSGHAQNALVFWGYLAWWIGRRWAWLGAAVIVASIAFSRLYLGVHFPLDIIGGLALGAAHFALLPRLERWAAADFPLPAVGWGMVTTGAVALLVTTGDSSLAALAGSTIGLTLAVGLLWPPTLPAAGAVVAAATVVIGLLTMGAVVAAVLVPFGAVSTVTLGTALGLAWIVSVGLYPRAVLAVATRRAARRSHPQ